VGCRVGQWGSAEGGDTPEKVLVQGSCGQAAARAVSGRRRRLGCSRAGGW
jgi:hypothetical protein